MPEKLADGRSNAANTVGAISVLVTMPARRVVLDVMSSAPAVRWFLPNVAHITGAR